eukprot:9473864-Pyramimonas_sp.AAC.4
MMYRMTAKKVGPQNQDDRCFVSLGYCAPANLGWYQSTLFVRCARLSPLQSDVPQRPTIDGRVVNARFSHAICDWPKLRRPIESTIGFITNSFQNRAREYLAKLSGRYNQPSRPCKTCHHQNMTSVTSRCRLVRHENIPALSASDWSV